MQWVEAAQWYRRGAAQGTRQQKSRLRCRSPGHTECPGTACGPSASCSRRRGPETQRGYGITKDLAKALQWPQRAEDRGDEEAWELIEPLSMASTDGTSMTGRVMQAVKRSNVRAEPGTSHATVSILKLGERLCVIERIGSHSAHHTTCRVAVARRSVSTSLFILLKRARMQTMNVRGMEFLPTSRNHSQACGNGRVARQGIVNFRYAHVFSSHVRRRPASWQNERLENFPFSRWVNLRSNR